MRPSAWPWRAPSTRCSRVPTPPLAMTGTRTGAGDAARQLQVVAGLGPVPIHGGHEDLPGAEPGADHGPGRGVEAGGTPATVGEDLPMAAVADAAGVDRHDDALRSELAREGVDQIGCRHRGRVDRDLVGPCSEKRATVPHRADAAPHGEGNEDLFRRPFHDVQHRGAVVRRSGDVEQHELVGSLRRRNGRPARRDRRRRAAPRTRCP